MRNHFFYWTGVPPPSTHDFTCGHRFESLEDIELRDRREKAEHREKEKKEKLRAERLRRMQAFQVPDGGREGVKNSLQILA